MDTLIWVWAYRLPNSWHWMPDQVCDLCTYFLGRSSWFRSKFCLFLAKVHFCILFRWSSCSSSGTNRVIKVSFFVLMPKLRYCIGIKKFRQYLLLPCALFYTLLSPSSPPLPSLLPSSPPFLILLPPSLLLHLLPRCPSKAECLWGVFIGLISGRWRSLGGAGDKAAKAGNAIYQTPHKPSQASPGRGAREAGRGKKKGNDSPSPSRHKGSSVTGRLTCTG